MRAAFKLVLLAGLVAVPSGVAAEKPAEKTEKAAGNKADGKTVVVPFELLPSRHMAVQVKINGKGPYRLVFDTGAPMNLINNKIAKAAGVLDPKAKKPSFGMFGAMGQHEMKTLEVGPAKLEKVPTVVMDHPTVAAIAEVLGPVDGIIGFPFFARYKMTVDYQKKELTLVPNGYVPGDYLEGLMAKLMDAQNQSKDPKILAPAAVWGLVVDKEKDDEDAGVVVKDVHAGGPAATAGLKAGDRVLTIDGRWTDNISDTFLAATLVKPGRAAVVVVTRDGKEVKLSVKPVKGV
ncbi:MAG: serine endoprotease [Gemmataceae bacterium]|nr:serine endoprotease [Gemmataceae bacterium]